MADTQYQEHVKAFSKVGEFIGLLCVSWLTGRQVAAVGDAEPEAEELLTRKEAAAQLKISVSLLDTMRRQGNITPAKCLGRVVRYSQKEVDRLKNRKRE